LGGGGQAVQIIDIIGCIWIRWGLANPDSRNNKKMKMKKKKSSGPATMLKSEWSKKSTRFKRMQWLSLKFYLMTSVQAKK
jgi:hypothetical protein